MITLFNKSKPLNTIGIYILSETVLPSIKCNRHNKRHTHRSLKFEAQKTIPETFRIE